MSDKLLSSSIKAHINWNRVETSKSDDDIFFHKGETTYWQYAIVTAYESFDSLVSSFWFGSSLSCTQKNTRGIFSFFFPKTWKKVSLHSRHCATWLCTGGHSFLLAPLVFCVRGANLIFFLSFYLCSGSVTPLLRLILPPCCHLLLLPQRRPFHIFLGLARKLSELEMWTKVKGIFLFKSRSNKLLSNSRAFFTYCRSPAVWLTPFIYLLYAALPAPPHNKKKGGCFASPSLSAISIKAVVDLPAESLE